MRTVAALALAMLVARPSQGQLAPAEVHARIADFIANRAPAPLPEGDTLVSWNGDHPVLFHTGRRDSGGVRAGMLRADRMFGSADVRWSADRPRSFLVRWLRPSASALDSTIIRGRVEPRGLRISRLRAADTILALPTGAWAVADYGMEELLLPVFERASNEAVAVAVLRPYGLKWDTVRVRAGATRSGWRVVRWAEGDSINWSAVLQGSHLLWIRRSDHPDNETVALEGTALRSWLEGIRGDAEPASRPSRLDEH